MLRFFMNLFKIGKTKKDKDFMEVEVDKENGKMIIRTNKDLSPDDIAEILRENL